MSFSKYTCRSSLQKLENINIIKALELDMNTSAGRHGSKKRWSRWFFFILHIENLISLVWQNVYVTTESIRLIMVNEFSKHKQHRLKLYESEFIYCILIPRASMGSIFSFFLLWDTSPILIYPLKYLHTYILAIYKLTMQQSIPIVLGNRVEFI